MVSNLKKASTTLLLLAFALLFFTLAPTYANVTTANVKATPSSPADVQVDQINHTIQIQEGGLVIINDTLKLSSKSEDLLQDFSLGFPYKIYDTKTIDALDYSFAYDASNPDTRFEVELDAGLGGRLGFYGVNVIFPEPGLNISNGGRDLTVVFVFSNLVSSETEELYNLDFPLYPSLTQNATVCNVTVILPPDAHYGTGTFDEKGLDFYNITLGDSQVLKHAKSPLNSFAYEPAWLTFHVHRDEPEPPFLLVDVNEIKREITLDQWGDAYVSNFFDITNRGYDISNVKVGFPEGAYDLAVRDEIGRIGKLTEKETVTVYIRETLYTDETGNFFLSYRIPWEKYISQHNGLNYDMTFNFFEGFDWTIRKLTVSITLFEGAEFEPLSVNELVDELVLRGLDFTYSVEKSVFQETVTFTLFNVTPFQDLNFNLTYRYSAFWASFHPTLWMGVLVIAACAIALLWRAPKPLAVPMVPVPPEDLRSFVEAYEGKTTILSELESMGEQLRKGRIPRRRYKVRKKMLEGRLSTLSRDLSNLREKIRAAGPKYANIMRQIEVAETMLEGVEKDIRRVEARYRRGEISKGAYGRLIEEYRRRRERAMTTIDGVLLRLREEIR